MSHEKSEDFYEPPYMTPALNTMWKKKRRLQSKERIYRVKTIELQIKHIIINSASLKRGETNSRKWWKFGNSKRKEETHVNCEVSAMDLNTYFATICTDTDPQRPILSDVGVCEHQNLMFTIFSELLNLFRDRQRHLTRFFFGYLKETHKF